MGFSNAGIPPLCVTSPPIRYLSYDFNYVVVDQGYPNPFFAGFVTHTKDRAVKTLAEIPFTVETAIIHDGTLTFPGGSANYLPLWPPIDPRHNKVVTASFVDGHSKPVHATAALDASGKQTGGTALDGAAVLEWTITDSGPYNGWDTMSGLAMQRPDGSWYNWLPIPK